VRDRGRESLTVKTIASSKGIALACISFLILASPAQAQRGFLPPEEFDHPFEGRVVIQEAKDRDYVRRLCPNMPFTIDPLGCSYIFRGIRLCGIVKVPDEDIRAAGHDPEVFMRHELGHCNGWGSDHKGAR
jgi:hypothetical protein